MTEIYNGIEYTKPKVIKLNETGIGVAEVAARTCYDSFQNSEHSYLNDFPMMVDAHDDGDDELTQILKDINDTDDSELLSQLAWTYFHHSILEHASVSYLIKGTSRGVLQEHARHRIQSISVRSTRYTMSDIINPFLVSYFKIKNYELKYDYFFNKIMKLDMFVTTDVVYNNIEVRCMYDKLRYQLHQIGEEAFLKLTVAGSIIDNFKGSPTPIGALEVLRSKKKRNVGDALKHIVTDNWKVDLVVTFNLRSLKNYFDLRDSGAAWFQINWLAKAMKEVTPEKYLKLIDKKYKDVKDGSEN